MKKVQRITSVIIALTVLVMTLVACAMPDGGYYYPSSSASFTEIEENPFISTSESSSSYFSVDCNTASFPMLKSWLESGIFPEKDMFRIEEMLNYFEYDYVIPQKGETFAMNSVVVDAPWSQNKLMMIQIAAEEIEMSSLSSNVVFLIDKSGSMSSENKLPVLKEAMKALADNLGQNDTVSIVTYANGVEALLDGGNASNVEKIKRAIDRLDASGGTYGQGGIQKAYELARKHFIEGGNNRIVLITDGDFNIGKTGDELIDYVKQMRDSGIYLTVFGVGNDNLQADFMEELALEGNGYWGFLGSKEDAYRQLSQGINSSMVTVAKDTKAYIEFNPEVVSSYRLMGYENKLLDEDDYNNDEKDAGEVNSGFTLTVVYEIVTTDNSGNYATANLKYKQPDGGVQSIEVSHIVTADKYTVNLSDDEKLILSLIEFALYGRSSPYKGTADLNRAISRIENLDFDGDEVKQSVVDVIRMYQRLEEDRIQGH